MIRIFMWMMLGLLVLFVVTLIGLANAGRGQEISVLIAHVPAGDKWGHFLLFGGLAFLANAAMNGARLQLGSFTVLKGSLFVLIPTVLEEFSQIFFPSRTFDLVDLAADMAGIFLGGLLAVWFVNQINCWNASTIRSSRVGPMNLLPVVGADARRRNVRTVEPIHLATLAPADIAVRGQGERPTSSSSDTPGV